MEHAEKENYLTNSEIDESSCIILKNYLRRHNQFVTGNKSVLVARAKGVSTLNLPDVKKLELSEQDFLQKRKTSKLVTPLGERLPEPGSLKSWSCDLGQCPDFVDSDIYNYLVLKMKCKRHLRSKVYLEDGHVHSVQYHHISEESQHCFVKCKVIPSLPSASEKKNPDHDVWLCLSKVTGQVHSAECDCTIGKSESCNHIGAFLYTLVAITVNKKEGLLASTSKKCLWNDPRKRKLSPKKSESLIFKRCNFEDNTLPVIKPSKVQTPHTFKAIVNEQRFGEKLKLCNPRAGWLLNFVEKQVVVPSVPQLLEIPFCYHDSVDLQSDSVKSEMAHVFESFDMSEADTKRVEELTRGQVTNSKWMDERSIRITSSNFGQIINLKESTKPESTVRNMMYSSQVRSKYMDWGRKHESAARMKYKIIMNKLHSNTKVVQCGLMVSPTMPYLGASPDGVVRYTDNGRTMEGLLEIKCPASDKWRMMPPKQCALDKTFYMEIDQKSENPVLKRNHAYYMQVQGQLAVSGHQWCDFVVWTLGGVFVERIYFDKECWAHA